jgi:hypothetical protein
MTYSQKNPIAFNEKPASSVKMNEEFVQIYGALNEIDGLKAPLASPTFTGTPTAPTATKTTNTTQLATTAFVKDVVADYVPTSSTTTTPTASSIPVADANGDIADGWIPETVARTESPALTGSPTAPTQPASDDSTKIATTAYVKDQVASDTVAGMVELATPAEVLAGVDTERGITPATLTAKILGTVSQSSGVPTGAVIERGSNANGEYVKFADGTLICTKHISDPGSPQPIVYITGLYRYSIGWTLPATIYGSYFAGGGGQDQSNTILSVSRGTYTSTSVSMLAYSQSNPMTTVALTFIAIGRWF